MSQRRARYESDLPEFCGRPSAAAGCGRVEREPVMSATVDENQESLPAPAAEGPQTPLSPAAVFWYSVANIGCGAFFSFNNYVLPLFLERYTHNAVLLGLMGSSHSVEGAVIQPLVGSASDHVHSPI